MAEIAGFRESFAAGLAGVLAEDAPVLDGVFPILLTTV
jgi:hypothetical protein